MNARAYVSKPVIIHAIEWRGDNRAEIRDFLGDRYFLIEGSRSIGVRTLEGDMMASIGDFIIRGIKGEFYPCKPDVFHAKYEEIEDAVSI